MASSSSSSKLSSFSKLSPHAIPFVPQQPQFSLSAKSTAFYPPQPQISEPQFGLLGFDDSFFSSSSNLLGLDGYPCPSYQGFCPKDCKISGAASSASITESCNASHSNSSSKYYIPQNYRCSINTEAHYPVSVGSFSAHVYALSAPKTNLFTDSLTKTVNSAQALPRSTSGQKICEEGLDGGSRQDDNICIHTVVDVHSSLNKRLPSSWGCESSLSNKPIKLPESSTSEGDSDVDSPCWKGTLSYQRSPFCVDDAVTHLLAVNSVHDNDCAETICYSENSKILISDEIEKVSSTSYAEKPVNVALAGMLKRSEQSCEVELEGSSKGIKCFDNFDEQSNSEGQDNVVLRLDEGTRVMSAIMSRSAEDNSLPESGLKDSARYSSSSNQCYTVDVTPNVIVESCGSGTDVLPGQPSIIAVHEQLIDETLQFLRKRLLSHTYKDENTLMELLSNIRLLVNDCPESFVLKNQKCTEEIFHNSVHEFTPSPRIIGLTGDAVSDSHIDITHDMERLAHLEDSSTSDMFDDLPSDPTILEDIANEFEKIVKYSFCGRDGNLHSLTYKNLWIKSQVGLLAMKYQLQLAHSEIQMLKHNHLAMGTTRSCETLVE